MQTNLKKIVTLATFASVLAACVSSESSTHNPPTQQDFQQSQSKSGDIAAGNTAEYTVPINTQKELNYKKDAESAIIYTSEGYLDRAKGKLIRAKNLQKKHGYNLVISGYATGYYYQNIGVNAVAGRYYRETVNNHSKNFEAINFYT